MAKILLRDRLEYKSFFDLLNSVNYTEISMDQIPANPTAFIDVISAEENNMILLRDRLEYKEPSSGVDSGVQFKDEDLIHAAPSEEINRIFGNIGTYEHPSGAFRITGSINSDGHIGPHTPSSGTFSISNGTLYNEPIRMYNSNIHIDSTSDNVGIGSVHPNPELNIVNDNSSSLINFSSDESNVHFNNVQLTGDNVTISRDLVDQLLNSNFLVNGVTISMLEYLSVMFTSLREENPERINEVRDALNNV